MAALAAAPASAREDSFSALQALNAQPLSAAEMEEVRGQAYTLAVLALRSYAAKTTSTQTSTQYTTIATSLSKVTVVTQTYYLRTSTGLVLVRR